MPTTPPTIMDDDDFTRAVLVEGDLSPETAHDHSGTVLETVTGCGQRCAKCLACKRGDVHTEAGE